MVELSQKKAQFNLANSGELNSATKNCFKKECLVLYKHFSLVGVGQYFNSLLLFCVHAYMCVIGKLRFERNS